MMLLPLPITIFEVLVETLGCVRVDYLDYLDNLRLKRTNVVTRCSGTPLRCGMRGSESGTQQVNSAPPLMNTSLPEVVSIIS